MTIEINYAQRQYIISADSYLLGHTETYAAAYAIEASYLEAKHSAMMGGDPLLLEAGQAQCAFLGCVQTRTHEDTGFCCYHDEQQTGCRCNCHDDKSPCDICDDSGEYCNYCNPHPMFDQPLLAQCAAFVRAVGANQPIVDIIPWQKRLDAALQQEGW